MFLSSGHGGNEEQLMFDKHSANRRKLLWLAGTGIIGAVLGERALAASTEPITTTGLSDTVTTVDMSTWPSGSRSAETSANFEHRLAGVFKADGTIVRGYLVDSCTLKGVGEYLITWKLPLQGEVKTNFAATIGSALDEPVEPGFITVGLTSDPRQLRVRTYDITGKPAARPFHIAAFRDQ
jgi:hypothetical protein